MPTPDYIRRLRRFVGTELLLLPAVVGVVFRETAGGSELLLTRRADTGWWALPAGILEPNEQPAAGLRRELREETCIEAEVERLALVGVDPEIRYPNGDRCQFLTLTFRCHHRGGQAAVGDEESTEVAWFALDRLPELSEVAHYRIGCAREPHGETVF